MLFKIITFFLHDVVNCASVLRLDSPIVTRAVIASVIRTSVIVPAVFEQLERSFVHELHIIDDLPKHALGARWCRKAAPVYPPFSKVDMREQPL